MYYKSDDLRGLFKAASFVIQAICFKETGKYITRQADLLEYVSPKEQKIINTFISLKNGSEIDFQEMSENLFFWTQNLISFL